MNKINKHLSFFLILLFLLFYPLLFAEETVTITTYYPSPYGVYNSLQVDKLGVGDNSGDGSLNSADVPTTSGDAWVKGKVGIGTAAPTNKFTIVDNTLNTAAAYINQTNGGDLLVLAAGGAEKFRVTNAGSVGIGTAAPKISGVTRALTISAGTTGNVDTALELQARRDTTGASVGSIYFYSAANLVSIISANRGVADDEGWLRFLVKKAGLSNCAEAMRIDADGRVGIWSTPSELFSVGSNAFQVNYTGNLVKVNNVAYSWPSSQGGASTALTNDGSGNLSWGAGASGITATLTFAVPCNYSGTTSIDVTNGIITGYTTGYGDCADSGDDSG